MNTLRKFEVDCSFNPYCSIISEGLKHRISPPPYMSLSISALSREMCFHKKSLIPIVHKFSTKTIAPPCERVNLSGRGAVEEPEEIRGR